MRILHLPTPVGGNAWRLAQGEKTLGFSSNVLVAIDSWFKYPCDINLNIDKSGNKITVFAQLLKCFFEIRNQYDIFHFNYGSSLLHYPQFSLNQVDLPFYPKKAKLFVTYNGCDIRQKYPTMQQRKVAACHNENCANGLCNSGQQDEYRRQGLKKMKQYASHIWALNPDLMRFLPPEKSSFLPYALEIKATDSFSIPKFNKKLSIIHAPTDRAVKGSLFIFEAMDKLQKTHGPDFEFHIIENIPHAQALKIYAEADLVIDQLLVGWYGGFAIECMKMGKPVISRVAEEDLLHLPTQMAKDVREAVISADPYSIHTVLQRCIEDRSYLKQQAQNAFEYVSKWHDSKYVASLTSQAYEKALAEP